MSFPKEIHRGSDGYSTMRLESYDLSVEQWMVWFAMSSHAAPALSWRPDETGVRMYVNRIGNGVMFGVVTMGHSGKSDSYRRFSSATKAIAYHELLAKDIVERIDLMESHEVPALAEGAL